MSIDAGVTIARWFAHEAARVHLALYETDEDRGHWQIIELIQRRGGSVTARELMRSSRQYPTAADAESALDDLAKAGIGRWEDSGPTPQGGRPTRRLVLDDAVDVDKTPSNLGATLGCVNVNAIDGAEEVDSVNTVPTEATAENSHDGGGI